MGAGGKPGAGPVVALGGAHPYGLRDGSVPRPAAGGGRQGRRAGPARPLARATPAAIAECWRRSPKWPAGMASGSRAIAGTGWPCTRASRPMWLRSQRFRMSDGFPRVHKVWCAVDCGVAVNPNIIRAQIEGGDRLWPRRDPLRRDHPGRRRTRAAGRISTPIACCGSTRCRRSKWPSSTATPIRRASASRGRRRSGPRSPMRGGR